MAARSEPSDRPESDEITDDELIGWFSDPEQQSSVLLKWMDATTVLTASRHQPASDSDLARDTWERGCRLLRKIKGNYVAVYHFLDGLIAKMQSLQPFIATIQSLQPETNAGNSTEKSKSLRGRTHRLKSMQ